MESYEEKTRSELIIDHGNCITAYTLANDAIEFEAIGKAIITANFDVNLGAGAKIKPKKDEWKVNGLLVA